GLTNKILAKLSTVVLQAFPSVFERGVTMGNPVRQAICNIEKPEVRYSSNNNKQENLRLLVVGGSLGAAKLNEVIPQALQKIDKAKRPEVIHQTGLKNIESAKKFYTDAGVEVRVEAFIDDMASSHLGILPLLTVKACFDAVINCSHKGDNFDLEHCFEKSLSINICD
ncbi:MAG: hypothetical protein JKY93_12785, partial [Gammaproteobacteria bacterium]|nr:hypothetical protein [Gammaproteobacteria bacterium]